MKSLVLIDTSNLVYRSHFVHKELKSSRGEPTGILYGVLSTMQRVERAYKGPHIMFCWDSLPTLEYKKSWRYSIFSGYKGSRKKDSGDLELILRQLPKLYRVIRNLGYLQFGVPGIEADDLIGILSSGLRKDYDRIYILSSDLDMYQLVRDNIVCLAMGRGKLKEVGEKQVLSATGVMPKQIAAYKALVGDSSDNYSGLNSIGPKRAVALLASGADPSKPFGKQSRFIRRKYAELRSSWTQAQVCYRLARIPRSPDYPLLPDDTVPMLREVLLEASSFTGRIFTEESEEEAIKKFIAFCGRFDLNLFLANRRRFFEYAKILPKK